jgi:hypothetical protein
MAQHTHFTKAVIEALGPALGGGRAYYNDTRVPGLQLQVTANGTKTYYVYRRIKGRPKRVKLGRHPDMTPAQAREQAKICVGQIAAGEDPAERRRAERADTVTLGDAFEEFLAVRSLTPKTQYVYRKVMDRAFADWKRRALPKLSKD